MSKEEIEKAKEIINKFMNNEMQRDKLERDCRCGGWKIGDVYKHLELNPSIETLIQYLAQLEAENNKQNKMIEEMAKAYMKVTSEKYRIKKICEKGKCQNEECHEDDWTECIKQYFEEKVEET